MKGQFILLTVTLSLIFFATVNAADGKNESTITESKKASDELSLNGTSECDSTLAEVTSQIETALLIGTKEWPTTLDAINKHCDLGQKLYKGIRKYGKCLKGVPRQAVSIFLRGLKKFIQSICLSNKKKQESIDILKCASGDTIKGWAECLRNANQRMDLTATNASDPAVIGNICCTYSSLEECISTKTSSLPGCIKKGSKYDTPSFLQSSVNLVLKDLTDLLCTNYATKESCEVHNAERAEVLKKLEDGKHVVQGAFLLSPLVRATSQMSAIHADDV